MSGGAFKNKLAKPIAAEGLYVEIYGSSLFEPDKRELMLFDTLGRPIEEAYIQSGRGNEGFITVKNVKAAQKIIVKHNLQGRVVGRIEQREDKMTGVTLNGIKGSDGKNIYFSGNENKAS